MSSFESCFVHVLVGGAYGLLLSCRSSLVAKRVALLAFWDYLKRVCFVCDCTGLLGERWNGDGSKFLYLSCF